MPASASAESVWDTVGNALGERLAEDLRDLVRAHEAAAERSHQQHLGPSQIGDPCTRCLARAVLGVPVRRQFDDPWCRIIGTAVHAWLEDAAIEDCQGRDDVRWLPETKVQPDPDLLPSGGRCDLYDAATRTVIDHKVIGTARLRHFRASGPGIGYRRQAHLYGLGYVNAGRAVDNVAVAFWQRGGRLSDLHVWTEPYDPSVAEQALTRFRTVRDLALATGEAILPMLPAHADCFACGGEEPTPTSQTPPGMAQPERTQP